MNKIKNLDELHAEYKIVSVVNTNKSNKLKYPFKYVICRKIRIFGLTFWLKSSTYSLSESSALDEVENMVLLKQHREKQKLIKKNKKLAPCTPLPIYLNGEGKKIS